MSARLDGKVAVVTGAAAGIGRSCAERLALEGARVVVADLDQAGAERTAAGIRESEGEAVACRVDVAMEQDVVNMIRTATETFGRLDVLHNNAARTDSLAAAADVDIEDADPSVWMASYQVNVIGVMLACKHAVPVMRMGGGGSIVNTSSAAGLAASGASPSYGATKAAVNLLTMHVATSHGRDGIRCNAVAPGVVLTDNVRGRLDDAALLRYTSKASLRRAALPSDLASVVAFLASDDAALITGEIISVDGGLRSALPYATSMLSPGRTSE